MPEPLKSSHHETWFFDTEYVPCVETGRKVYETTASDDYVRGLMYQEAGATDAEPQPNLKSILYRFVAISTVVRIGKGENVDLSIRSLPTANMEFDEGQMLAGFLHTIGKRRPQLVGYGSTSFDLPMLYQRAVINGVEIGQFCIRPEKPWDPIPDYFSDRNEWNVDLARVVGGYALTPKLSQIAAACGIPSKIGMDGSQVADAWFAGKRQEIVNYCECDALTNYLLWLSIAHTSGILRYEEIVAEENALAALLNREREAKPHLGEFLDQWAANRKLVLEVAA